jgi:hypothetical protein
MPCKHVEAFRRSGVIASVLPDQSIASSVQGITSNSSNPTIRVQTPYWSLSGMVISTDFEARPQGNMHVSRSKTLTLSCGVRVGVRLISTNMHLMVHSVFNGVKLNRITSVGVLYTIR